MKETRVKYMSWTEFDEKRKHTKTVIIPSGAVEIYGPHLPLGSDIIVAEKVAMLVAEKVGAVVGPFLEIGQSNVLYDMPGTIYAHPEHLKSIYRDICESFIKWGFDRIFILNTHLGNTFPLNELLEDLQNEHPGVKCGSVGWWQYIPHLTQDVFTTPNPHGHASEAGTSVLMYLAPETVHMDRAKVTENKVTDKYPCINKYRPFGDFTDTGTIGDPFAASEEKGRLAVERGVEEITSFIQDYFA